MAVQNIRVICHVVITTMQFAYAVSAKSGECQLKNNDVFFSDSSDYAIFEFSICISICLNKDTVIYMMNLINDQFNSSIGLRSVGQGLA